MDARNKFTPGPWAAYGRVDGRISIKAGEACLIAVVAKQPAAWEANAALIAAAPSLAEQLKHLFYETRLEITPERNDEILKLLESIYGRT